MSKDVRIFFGLLLTIVLGAVMFVAAEIAIGGGECNRADCSWLGDLAYGSSASILFAACLLFAGVLVWGISSLVGRIASRHPMRH